VTEETPAGSARRTDAFVGPHGVRAGWRILLFCALCAVGTPLAGLPVALLGLGELAAGFVALLAAGLAASWVMLRFVDRRPFAALGFAPEPRAARDSLLGFGVGGAVLGGTVAVLAMAGTVRWVADDGTAADYAATLAGLLVSFAVAAAAEEVLFRGYAFQALVQGIGAWPATLLLSAAFALGHAGNPNVSWPGLANIFLAGVMLSVAYLRTRSLWFATAVHLGWNWVMSALLDFPVSGLQLDTPLYDVRKLGGAEWLTGGTFGPEAGLAATAFITAATLWMLRTPLLAESARMRDARPLVDTTLGERWNGR
jgi:hypothetical protein